MDIKTHTDYKTFASAAADNSTTAEGGDFPFFGIVKNSSAQDIITGLNSIENTLSKLSLKFRVYDIYNIQATIANQDECDIKLNALTNNTAAVINSDRQLTTYIRGEQVLLTRGDVIYKDNAGDLQHIKSNSGGWYKPSLAEKSNWIKFTYTNSDKEPLSLQANPVKISQIYGLYGVAGANSTAATLEENRLKFINDNTKHPIYPLVKNYRSMGSGKDEICLDDPFFTLDYNIITDDAENSKFTLKYQNRNLSVSYVIK